MSGVCVVARFDGRAVEPDALDALVAAAPYRGADGVGHWFGSGVGIAQQLLRVTGAERAEPVVDDELVVVADARLDNRPELLAALRDVDPDTTDVDLIVAAYRRWGTGFPARLLGDFAVVLWDNRARVLIAARDPMAMRMLAYHHAATRIIVATEVKQVLAGPGVTARLHERHVAADLIGHLGQPDWSAYQDVRVLAPGHILRVDKHGARSWPFWAPDPEHRVRHRHAEDYVDHFRELFTAAVADRLRTDHTVGVLLSGGVDSVSVAATAGWLGRVDTRTAPRIHTCTAVFDELTECDERDVARAISDTYGFGRSEVAADHLWPLRDFPAHGPPRDEPFVGALQPMIDGSLDALRDAGARVVLGGDRGDLVVGWTGFRYLPLVQRRQWSELRDELTEQRSATGDPLTALAWQHLLVPAAVRGRLRLARFRAHGWSPGAHRIKRSMPDWLDPRFAERIGLAHLPPAGPVPPPGFGPSRRLRHDWIFAQLHIRGMAWSERSYAERGLVFADPFSDRRLAEFALAVPQAAITTPGDHGKPLMRSAMRGIVPDDTLRRAGKVTPRPLFDRGLFDEAVGTVRSLLVDMETARRGWVSERQAREAYERSLRAEALLAPFWELIVTEWWLRLYGT